MSSMRKDVCLSKSLRGCYKFQLLCEFDFAMSDILEALRKTASPLASETVLLSVLDPAPINYFYKHYHKINAFYFKASITKKEATAEPSLARSRQSDRCDHV